MNLAFLGSGCYFANQPIQINQMIADKKELMQQIVGWDVVNWSKAIDYWEKNAHLYGKELECLELGSSKGGMSLWLALNNNKVLCTDLNGPEPSAHDLHKKYGCDTRVTYESVDALHINYENKFDLVLFKSILGGICTDDDDKKVYLIDQMYKALKPGGMLLFAENLEGTALHKAARKRFGTKGWNYLRLSEMKQVFASFSSVQYSTTGFFGCFGRTERQRALLGKVDALLDKQIPAYSKYIVFGIAIK